MNFIWFMLFSTIEGLSVYALALYIFRYNFTRFIWHSLIIIELINLQNYLTRAELASMSYSAPTINILITILFFKIIVRIPILQSMFMTVVGYSIYMMLQTFIISFSFSLAKIQADPVKGYIVQCLTGVIGTFIGWAVYRKGFGFTFNFERLRFKGEQVFVMILIIVFILALLLMMYFQDVYANLFGFLLTLIIFLFYSIRKEARQID
ncbi:hypothetical protein [Paenibacillus spongiae]|uniref:YitT family protein n=1 Tax=Paenibacillus spongiae TaxID=2909671 RepID=A0ABY5S532_9BACL|nr:hypothetical protein [Paenibacillus spongiae]UVI28598.1 hypothetical protein L1F29_24570 [Paenibacillus spongiae]